MGTFTNQVQGLVSEEKQRRIEREQAKKRKIHQSDLILKLDNYFYNYFSKYQGESQKALFTLYSVNNRTKILIDIAENNSTDSTYLNKHYEKELHKIYNIFKNNDTFLNGGQTNNQTIENKLKDTFSKCFERDGLEFGNINLSLYETKKEILDNIPENIIEYNYIDQNYEKILNQVKKIYENDKKAKQQILKIQQKLETEKQAQNSTLKIIFLFLGKIVKWCFIITVGAIWFIWKILTNISSKA